MEHSSPNAHAIRYTNRLAQEVGTLAVDGWAVRFGTSRRGLGKPQPAQSLGNITKYNNLHTQESFGKKIHTLSIFA